MSVYTHSVLLLSILGINQFRMDLNIKSEARSFPVFFPTVYVGTYKSIVF